MGAKAVDLGSAQLVAAPSECPERMPVKITSAPGGYEGEGFPVKRAFAGVPQELLDPFVHLDEMGEVEYGPGEPKGTPWHPHRGFETVTYMLEGAFVHQDSIGGGGDLGPGDTQWMTAGSGILHIERPPEGLVVAGGLFHGLQLWVNLPKAKKWADPRYQDIDGSRVGLGANSERDAVVRVIAGSVGEVAGPGVTHTPINMLHVTLMPGSRLRLPWPERFNALVYTMQGTAQVSSKRVPLGASHLAVLGTGGVIELANAGQTFAEVILLGGEPIREAVARYGPFVMNTREELVQAFEDYEAGRMGQIPPGRLGS